MLQGLHRLIIYKYNFGAGNPNDTDELITPNPNNVGIGLPFEQDKLTTAFSPTNFLFNKYLWYRHLQILL